MERNYAVETALPKCAGIKLATGVVICHRDHLRPGFENPRTGG